MNTPISKKNLEAATGSIPQKKVFWKILQNLQERTRVGVSFLIKLQITGLQPYW